jgi:hypothetical protein
LLKGFGSSSVTHRPIDIHILRHLHFPSMDSYVLLVHGPNKSNTFLCTSLPPIIPPSNIVAKRQEDSCCRDSLLLSNLLPFLIKLDPKEEFHQTKSSFGSNCRVFTLNFSHNRHAYYVPYIILQFVFLFFPYWDIGPKVTIVCRKLYKTFQANTNLCTREELFDYANHVLWVVFYVTSLEHKSFSLNHLLFMGMEFCFPML